MKTMNTPQTLRPPNHNMESRRLCRLFFMLAFLPTICSGMDAPNLTLESTVFVALAGEDLTIKCDVRKPANLGVDNMTCSDPLHKEIYNCNITETKDQTKNISLKLHLQQLNDSGEYSCQYQTVKVYWFLRVRRDGYTRPIDYTFIIMSVFTGVLLVFSVVGSVYVFRGHQKEQITQCGEMGGKRKQNREKRKAREMKDDNIDVTTAPSTSLYASLETRPRSIYDVLDHSAAKRESDQGKTKAKKNEPQKTTEQTAQHQEEGVFESVYENF
ncbi:NFAT activation molecule 1 isoform X2 [Trachinotus anak]|uniref:NFAT activation molecule 1 isoform X2 n=1 Tax=Trachinotus anak TaxID=443729 RepID=UPI0039F19C4D